MKTKKAASIPEKKDEKSRREFLLKAGKMALYIPPAMMVLMHPSRNAFACNKSLSIPKCDNCGTDYGGGWSGGRHHHRPR
jgi:hypothetical protein